MLEKTFEILTNLILILLGSVIVLLLLAILYLELDSRYDIAAYENLQIYTEGSRFQADCAVNFGISKRQRHECV